MNDITLPKIDLNARLGRSLLFAVAAGVVVTLIAGSRSDLWPYAALTGLFIATVFCAKAFRQYRYYIFELSFGDTGRISFLRGKEARTVTVDWNDVEVTKCFKWGKIRIPYLVIRSKRGSLVVKQYLIGEWNEALMDKVLNAVALARP